MYGFDGLITVTVGDGDVETVVGVGCVGVFVAAVGIEIECAVGSRADAIAQGVIGIRISTENQAFVVGTC